MAAHSLDAVSPARHAGTETGVAMQPHMAIGHFYEVQTLMMVLPIQCWSRMYTRLELYKTLAADALAPHGAWSLVQTRMTIGLRVFLAF